jgi:hypothetical protein
MIRRDLNEKELKPGDIIDIHQTVNGQHLFVVIDPFILDIRYHMDINMKYEYDKEELLKPDKFTGDTTYEIVGNIDRKAPPMPKYEDYHSKVLNTYSITEAERMIDDEHYAYKDAMQEWWDSLTQMERAIEMKKDKDNQLNFYIKF